MSERFSKLCIFVIALVVMSYFLKLIASVAAPAALGALLGFVFSSMVSLLKKKRVPTVLTIPITVIFFVLISVLVIVIFFSTINSFVDKFAFYQERGTALLTALADAIPLVQGNILVEIQNKIFAFFTTSVVSVSKGAVGFSTGFVVALFVMIFVLLERNFLYFKLLEMFPRSRRGKKIFQAVESMDTQVSKFLVLKLLMSAITGGVVYIGFSVIGVDFPLLWGILTLGFNFIPSVGSILITAVSIVFSVLQFYPQWTPIIAVAALTLATQMIIGNVIDPLVTGDRLNVSPLVIFCSLLYWGWVWGILGALLAVPIAVIIQVISEALGFHSLNVSLAHGRVIFKRQKTGGHTKSTHVEKAFNKNTEDAIMHNSSSIEKPDNEHTQM